MVYDYYSPVGGTGPKVTFNCTEGSGQTPEIWPKRTTIPAALMSKAVEALALYAIKHYIFFLNGKGPGTRHTRPPSSAKKQTFREVLHEGWTDLTRLRTTTINIAITL